jgi:hypothetical protein
VTPALLHVPPSELGRIWPHIRPAIDRLSRLPGEDWLPEHVFHEIMSGGTYLFTTPDNRGFLVAQILVTPYSRTLHVWLASNEFAGARDDFFAQLKSIAEENRCNSITWRSDRTGWQRALPGVRATTHYSFELGD